MEDTNCAQAIVVCQSSMMRNAIASSLESNGIECAVEAEPARVAIIVSHLVEAPEIGQSFAKMPCMAAISPQYWVVMGQGEDDPIYRNLIEWGISPCLVPEDIDGDDLSHVVMLAASGHVISLCNSRRQTHAEDTRRLNRANLSQDQWDLLSLLADGLSNKEIAIRFDSTETAIKARLRCLLGKLGINNRTKAAVMAARCGIRPMEEPKVQTNVVTISAGGLRAA